MGSPFSIFYLTLCMPSKHLLSSSFSKILKIHSLMMQALQLAAEMSSCMTFKLTIGQIELTHRANHWCTALCTWPACVRVCTDVFQSGIYSAAAATFWQNASALTRLGSTDTAHLPRLKLVWEGLVRSSQMSKEPFDVNEDVAWLFHYITAVENKWACSRPWCYV